MVAGDAKSGRSPGGLEGLLDWLEAQECGSWQQRWLASGADAAGAGWLRLPGQWLSRRSGQARLVPWALTTAVCGDIVRPSLAWLLTAGYDADLAKAMAAFRDPQGFAQLAGLCGHGGGQAAKAARTQTLRRAAVILAAKGGMLAGIQAGDLLELLDTEADVLGAARPGAADSYRLLRQLGIFGAAAPARLRELRTAGQRTPEEMIDRHRLVPPDPRPAGRLPQRTPARPGLRQPGTAGPPAGHVLGRPGSPPSRHRQPAPERRDRRRVEAADADQTEDRHHGRRHQDRD
jgi:hypothetical protein